MMAPDIECRPKLKSPGPESGEVVAVVVGQLEVVAHRDRVERARDLAVAAEDAARHVDLVDGRVALAGGDALLGRVLGRDDADAVGRAGGGAQRAADALLQPRVLEAVQLVTPAEARVDGDLLLRVLVDDRALDERGRTSSSARAASRRTRGRGRRRRRARARAARRSPRRRPGSSADLDRVRSVEHHHEDRRHERVARWPAAAGPSSRSDISWS